MDVGGDWVAALAGMVCRCTLKLAREKDEIPQWSPKCKLTPCDRRLQRLVFLRKKPRVIHFESGASLRPILELRY